MIFQLLFTIIFGILGVLLFFLPGFGDVPLLLPWGLDSVVVTFASYVHGAIDTFPYLEVLLQVFIYGLMFEGALMFLKLFLGGRSPHS